MATFLLSLALAVCIIFLLASRAQRIAHNATRRILICALFLVPTATALLFAANRLPGLMHLYHLAAPPEDLYAPMSRIRLDLAKEGASATRRVSVKYYDLYSLGLTMADGSPFRFPGKDDSRGTSSLPGVLLLEVFCGGEALLQKEIGAHEALLWADRSMDTVKTIILTTFGVPALSPCSTEFDLRLSVRKAFYEANERDIPLDIVVSVSPLP
jgi:hypothetical protein